MGRNEPGEVVHAPRKCLVYVRELYANKYLESNFQSIDVRYIVLKIAHTMILLCLVILGANSLEIIHVPSFKNKVFLSGSPENHKKSFKHKDPILI